MHWNDPIPVCKQCSGEERDRSGPRQIKDWDRVEWESIFVLFILTVLIFYMTWRENFMTSWTCWTHCWHTDLGRWTDGQYFPLWKCRSLTWGKGVEFSEGTEKGETELALWCTRTSNTWLKHFGRNRVSIKIGSGGKAGFCTSKWASRSWVSCMQDFVSPYKTPFDASRRMMRVSQFEKPGVFRHTELVWPIIISFNRPAITSGNL